MSNEQKTVDWIAFRRDITQHKDIIALVDHYATTHESRTQTLARIIRHSPEYVDWLAAAYPGGFKHAHAKGRRGKDNPAARGQRSGRD